MRRAARERREYLYHKSQEEQKRALHGKKRKVKEGPDSALT